MKAPGTRTWLTSAGLLLITIGQLACGGGYEANPIHQGSRFLYVVNSIDSTVSAFRVPPGSGTLTAVGPPVATGQQPQYAAASSDGKFLYVANVSIDESGVSGFVINSSTGALTPTTPAIFRTTGDDQPLGIAVDPSSRHVYTANVASISAFEIDPNTGSLSDVAGTPVLSSNGAEPQDLKISPNGQFMYVTDGPTNTVSGYTFNASGLPVPMGEPIAAGNFPIGIVVDPAGKFVYVANSQSDSVSAYAVTPGTGVLVGNGTTPMQNGCLPQELAVDPSSKFLFVSCSGGGVNSIAQFSIDAATGTLTAILPSFATGANSTPRGIVVDPSGKFLFSAFSAANQAGSTGIGTAGTLGMSGGLANTGRGPVGVALSDPH